jgi:hypothetical protein
MKARPLAVPLTSLSPAAPPPHPLVSHAHHRRPLHSPPCPTTGPLPLSSSSDVAEGHTADGMEEQRRIKPPPRRRRHLLSFAPPRSARPSPSVAALPQIRPPLSLSARAATTKARGRRSSSLDGWREAVQPVPVPPFPSSPSSSRRSRGEETMVSASLDGTAQRGRLLPRLSARVGRPPPLPPMPVWRPCGGGGGGCLVVNPAAAACRWARRHWISAFFVF